MHSAPVPAITLGSGSHNEAANKNVFRGVFCGCFSRCHALCAAKQQDKLHLAQVLQGEHKHWQRVDSTARMCELGPNASSGGMRAAEYGRAMNFMA